MFNKTILKILFGEYFKANPFKNVKTITFIYGENKSFKWRTDDGLISTLLERIEALEEQMKKKK